MDKKQCILIGSLLLLAACGPAGDAGTGNAGPGVVATTRLIGDRAFRIAGDRATVITLMATGVDPHLFRPSEGDVRRMASADLILYNGLHLEGKMGEIFSRMGRSRPVVALGDAIPKDRLLELSGYQGLHDPHLWFDVRLWSLTVDPVLEALTGLMPEHTGELVDRADAVRTGLLELDRWVEEQIAAIPGDRRVLVTAHDAFGYFGARYGIEVVGLQGISTAAEAGLQDVDRLVNLIVGRKIPAIFIESSVPRRSIESVVAACINRGHAVRIGGELYSDAMGPAGTPEGAYDGMVRHNVRTITEALR
jgi:manganese/zinc/iron transport system substrate-binding protein